MISYIELENFKSLRHTGLVRMGNVTLLTGANGRGKSSFCQSLLVLSQTWRRGMMDNLLPNGIWKNMGEYDDLVCRFAQDKTIKIHIITDSDQDNDFELLFKKSSLLPSIGEVDSVKVNGRPINDDSGSSDSDGNESDALENESDDVNIRLSSLRDFPSLMALQRMYYVGAERIAAPDHQKLNDLTQYDYLAPNGDNVLSVLWDNKDKECIQKVQDSLKKVLDGGRIEIINEGNRLVLLINSVDDGNLFHPVNVGYGYSYILSLLTASVVAPKDSIIIVENPEAHLHPSAQARVMNELINTTKERDIQLIVETHSDHVLNTVLRAVKEEKITNDDLQVLFFSNKEDEHGNKEAIIQNLTVNSFGHILNPPMNFFEQYSIDLRALYTPFRNE